MDRQAQAWGWAGTLLEFAQLDATAWLQALMTHHRLRLSELPIGREQVVAWEAMFPLLRTSVEAVILQNPDLSGALVAFEYELPGEAGRRPDIVFVLPTGHMIVVECKNRSIPAISDLDQVVAYARDLNEYHAPSHALRSHCLLLLTKAGRQLKPIVTSHNVVVAQPVDGRLPALEEILLATQQEQVIHTDPLPWLHGEYAPLPSLIRAAVDTFRGHPLPSIKAVRATNIPDILAWLHDITATAERERRHHLVLLTGTPGSGKTLVGIQSVVDEADRGIAAMYLSGNGPLVGVLQDALDRLHVARPGRSLIRGMMEFKRYATRSLRHTPANFYVFDEGQRAWDRVKDYPGSEIQLLIDVASRRDWGVVLALLGEGQDIWRGEDGGISTWLRDFAMSEHHGRAWTVHAADTVALANAAADVNAEYRPKADLHLDRSLRSKQILHLHEWVNLLLSDAPASEVLRRAETLHTDGFPLYAATDRSLIENHVRQLYESTVDKRYGWVASSDSIARNHPGGITLLQTRYLHEAPRVYGAWFNDPPNSPNSCCALQTACKEFGCQGLELDYVLVQWGHDLLWRNGHWHIPARVRRSTEKPSEFTLNAYRVLLSRAREGLSILCEDEPTRERIERCGALALGAVQSPDFAVAISNMA